MPRTSVLAEAPCRPVSTDLLKAMKRDVLGHLAGIADDTLNIHHEHYAIRLAQLRLDHVAQARMSRQVHQSHGFARLWVGRRGEGNCRA